MTQLDKQRLQRLRGLFIEQTLRDRAHASYWRDDEDLQAYDLTLAARIRWKWAGVLNYINDLGWKWPSNIHIWDWGCGTGAASRTFLELNTSHAQTVFLTDRDTKAMSFAKKALKIMEAERDGFALSVHTEEPPKNNEVPIVLLVSHVVNELDDKGKRALQQAVNQSDLILMIEPGSRESSHGLGRLMTEWTDNLTVLAPCPHQMGCPIIRENRPDDWCHFFVKPPSWVFQDAQWAQWSRELGIDLRSLPVSYQFLVKKDRMAEFCSQWQKPDEGVMIGRPRMVKPGAQIWWCSGDGHVDLKNLKKRDPLFKKIKKYHL
jgi:hypothetical protein